MTYTLQQIKEIVREFGCTMTFDETHVTLQVPHVTVTLDRDFNPDEVKIRTFLVNHWTKFIRLTIDNEQNEKGGQP